MSITDFLLARIAEDQAAARAAIEMMKGPRWANDGTCVASGEDAFWVDGLNVRDPGWVAGHIARHDPARVLAECAAKREIVEAHPIVHDVVEVSTRMKWGFACETCFSYGDIVEDHGYCDTLLALAAVYADHPGYQDSWKVGA